ncbi:Two-component system histidine kinase RacS [hydrothermal vent metagenome]|uniref:histidine kinase n=1 Tax=hydrothermal vent metagenome TaxID=652676 RepID=A0A1W1EG99_9ZZZZ
MNRHSILFKLNILFAVALLATIISSASIIMHLMKKEHQDTMYKSRLLIQEYRLHKEIPTSLIDEMGFCEVNSTEKDKIISAIKLQKKHHKGKRGRVLSYDGHNYIHLNKMNVLLKNKSTFIERFIVPILIALSLIILLVFMYVMLRKSLIPLKKLQKDIVLYGNGELEEYELSSKKDEVALASNAFYTSVEKVKKMTDSRQLFIRNLFHELNTPVTKGKILAEIVEEPKTQKMLNSIFTKLSTLLKELAKMEKITSDNYNIDRVDVRVVELIDEAKDMLFLEEDIKTNVTNEMMNVDFSSMSIVFKNLIDNAQKYGKNLEIIYSKKDIYFISDGEELKGDFERYKEAFVKGEDSQNKKGFGLGLYIVNEIVSKHGMLFTYSYEDGKNIFAIKSLL